MWAHIPGSEDCLVKFLDITKCFKHEQVDATLNERCDLTPEGSTSLLKGGLTQGFYANPEWSD